MSLSARIAIDPSRRLPRLAATLPLGGVIVAATTLVQRTPQSLLLVALSTLAACLAILMALRRSASTRIVLTVSHHPEIAVQPDPAGLDGSWRLVESTMAWPGFTMLALRPFDPSVRAATVRVAVFVDELAAHDRRALGRYLIWSLHGATRGDPLSARP